MSGSMLCYSFAVWCVGFDVLHNIFTVCRIISPTTNKKYSEVLMYQLNTVLFSFVASSDYQYHSTNCAALPPPHPPTPNHKLLHVLLIQYFACSLLLQSVYLHQQLNSRSITVIIQKIMRWTTRKIMYWTTVCFIYCTFSILISLCAVCLIFFYSYPPQLSNSLSFDLVGTCTRQDYPNFWPDD